MMRAGGGEAGGFGFPGFVVRRKFAGGHAPAGGDGGATGEAFQTIAVPGTGTGEGGEGGRFGNADVTHLRVQQAVEGLAVNDGTAADAGADGNV
jgi:hypothetical protein